MKNNTGKIDIVFESMPESTVFHGDDGVETWKQVRGKLAAKIMKLTPELYEMGIRKVEVGSINWFYERKKTRGRFLNLNTMFLARLLKR